MKHSLLAAMVLAMSASPAMAAMNPCNPCAAKPAMNPCNPCAAKPAMNPCASKPAMNPCNPCAPKAEHAMATETVDPGTVNPATITYAQLRSLDAKGFMTVAQRGMSAGLPLMGGVPVGGHHVTLTGELIDMVCYESSGLTGGSHALCARVCALKGGPVGLLSGGKVYQILPAKAGMPVSDDVLNAIATKVRIEGDVNRRGGINTLAITKLKEI